MRPLYIILLSMCFSSCATFTKTINNKEAPSMIGQSADRLTQRWGKPSLVGQAANGNTVYAYITESSNYKQSQSAVVVSRGKVLNSGAAANGGNLPKLKCTSLFEIDKNNYIVSAKNHGNC